jgi:hypothetical protein
VCNCDCVQMCVRKCGCAKSVTISYLHTRVVGKNVCDVRVGVTEILAHSHCLGMSYYINFLSLGRNKYHIK